MNSIASTMKHFAKIVCALSIALSLSATSVAQAQADSTTTGSRGGPRRQLATILFAGLGGAVLGLSTLSFYGRPQDHLSNIAVGFAGGVVMGTVFATYKAATNPSEFYGTRSQFEREIALSQKSAVTPNRAPTFAMNFEF